MIRVKKADLLAVAHYLIGHLSYSQVPALAKGHKVEAKKDSASAQELLVKKVGACDEAELCKLLLEISLLDSAYQRSTANLCGFGDDSFSDVPLVDAPHLATTSSERQLVVAAST
jgi:hypothetical protein